MSDSATPCTAAGQVPLFSTICQSLLIDSMMLSNHLILCCPLLLLSSIFPSIRVLPNKLALCIKWPKYYSFSISSFNECSGLISFRIDWLISLQSNRFSIVSSTTIWKHQFTSAQLSLWSNSHIHTWLIEKLQFWLYGPLSAKWHLWILHNTKLL